MIRLPRIHLILLACFIALTFSWQCATAASTGILAGTITDLDGNGIPGANVSLYRGQNLVTVANNPQLTIGSPSRGQVGHYGFRGLAPGVYKVVVQKSYGGSREYKAVQQVSVTTGTVVQDIVLDVPAPTTAPTAMAYDGGQYNPMTAGFEALVAIFSLAGVAFLVRGRGK